jgi:glycerophosphoryl diester phosphodiesterase
MRILAHRGAPTIGRTENTVPAISAAVRSGADGVEVDLRLSADGVFVLCHDPDLQRLTGRSLQVACTSWPVLRSAAAGAGVPLARLEEVLPTVGTGRLVLELKPAPVETGQQLVRRLEQLDALGLHCEFTVSTFDADLLAAVRSTARERLRLRTALLGRPGWLALATVRQALLAGHEEAHPHVSDLLADPCAATEAAACGTDLVPWTVNSSRMMRRCADLGVAAVITDVPRKARAALATRVAAA